MKRHYTLIAIAVVACWMGLTWAGQPSPTPPNWGQVDFQGAWDCPAMPAETAAEIPNLSLTLTTSGGPLLVMATLNLANVTSQPQAAFLLPALDGQALAHDKGNLSHSLANLEAKGLVTITRTPGGQAEAVDLTPQGHQVATRLS